mgnify:CR=1 FL=1
MIKFGRVIEFPCKIVYNKINLEKERILNYEKE